MSSWKLVAARGRYVSWLDATASPMAGTSSEQALNDSFQRRTVAGSREARLSEELQFGTRNVQSQKKKRHPAIAVSTGSGEKVKWQLRGWRLPVPLSEIAKSAHRIRAAYLYQRIPARTCAVSWKFFLFPNFVFFYFRFSLGNWNCRIGRIGIPRQGAAAGAGWPAERESYILQGNPCVLLHY